MNKHFLPLLKLYLAVKKIKLKVTWEHRKSYKLSNVQKEIKIISLKKLIKKLIIKLVNMFKSKKISTTLCIERSFNQHNGQTNSTKSTEQSENQKANSVKAEVN